MRRVGIWLAALASVVSVGAAGIAALRSRPLDDALRKAAHADDGRLVRLLLHRGADPQTEDVSHVSLVDWALGENKPDIAAALLDAGAKTDLRFMLLHAAANDDWAIIGLLLERGGDPNLAGGQGRTLLHQAAAHGDAEGIRLLLEHRANPNARDARGRTPLMEAVRFNSHTMAAQDPEQLLLQHGADVNAQANDGATALTEALRTGNKGAVMLLLRHGANPRLVEKDGTAPLHLAVGAPEYDSRVIAGLLRAGADPTVADAKGETPVALARQMQRAQVVRYLTKPAQP